MPPLALIAPAIGTQIAIGLAMTAVGYGISTLISPDQEVLPMDSSANTGTLANITSTDAPIKLLFGNGRCGVNTVNAQSHGTNRNYLDMMVVLGEGPIHGIYREDGTLWKWGQIDGTEDNPPLIYFDDVLWTDWGEYVTAAFMRGLPDGEFIEGSFPGFSIRDEFEGAYSVKLLLRFKYDKENFNQLPRMITVKYKGLHLYNPLISAYDENNYNNPALIAYEFMTRPSTRGGMGIDYSRINMQYLSDAIDYCNTKGWTGDIIIHENTYATDNLRRILACFRGTIPPAPDGTFKLYYRDLKYEASAISLTESDVVAGSVTVQQPDVLSRPNTIRVKYHNANLDYQIGEYVFTDALALSEDGDTREITREVLGLTTLGKVKEMAFYLLERARNSKTVSLTVGRRGMGIENEELISLTLQDYGYSDQLFRVVSSAPELETFTVQLVLLEESPEFYDKNYDHVIDDLWETDLPDPNDPIPDVVGLTGYEVVYTNRNKEFVKWIIEFSGPTESEYPWWDGADIWVKTGATGKWVYRTRSESGFEIDPAQEGQYYDVRIVGRSVFGKKQSLSRAPHIYRTILGKTDAPAGMPFLMAVAEGTTVNLSGNQMATVNVDGWEVRLGSSFLGGIYVRDSLTPECSITSVRPGTHTFWMAPYRIASNLSADQPAAIMDDDGVWLSFDQALTTEPGRIYTDDPVSATCTVMIPQGLTSAATPNTWDYSANGTTSNTEETTYNSADALKCSHTSDVLTGTWTSADWDLGSAKKVKIWADFTTAFVSSDNTFDGIGGATLSFNDIGGATKSFKDLVGEVIGGRVTIRMSYSEDGSSYTAVDRFELHSADIYAQYINILVTITDPTLDSNVYVSEVTMRAYTGVA